MDVVDSFYTLVDRGLSGENSSLPIGLDKMEGYIEGLAQSVSYLIGASSGVGKTSLLLYSFVYKPIMANDKEKDVHYIYFNLEMGEEQILAKLLSIYIYEKYGEIVPFKEIFSRGRNTKLSKEHYELIKACRPVLQMFSERIIFHSGALTSDSFDAHMINDLKKFGTFDSNGNYIPFNPKQIVVTVIDHMSLVRAKGGQSKKDAMDAISNHSVLYRNKCKIVSNVLLMQLNRNSYGQERLKQGLQEPDESDFKDSGTMLEDSMIALLMFDPVKAKMATHRDYNIKILGSNYRSLKCVKNRFGTSDIAVGLGFYGEIGLFRELPKAKDITDWELYLDPSWTLKPDDEHEDAKLPDAKPNFNFKM